jgi:hypothetical protein
MRCAIDEVVLAMLLGMVVLSRLWLDNLCEVGI